MRRGTLARALAAAAAPETVVVTSLGSAGRAWRECAPAQRTYAASDPMGLACSLALGVALGLALDDPSPPRVLLVAGDGDLTLGLTALAAVGDAAPPHLSVCVFANGRYETGGGAPLAARGVDLPAVALAAGWAAAARLPGDATAAELDAAAAELLTAPGPRLLAVAVDPEPSPYGGPGELSQAEVQLDFRRALGARPWT
ncbi:MULTISPECIES: thiamine pyrophosphate-dependent enzyme [unclassified Blastococcus]